MRAADRGRPQTAARRPAIAAPGGAPTDAGLLHARGSPLRRRAPASGPAPAPVLQFGNRQRCRFRADARGRPPHHAHLPPSLALGGPEQFHVAPGRHRARSARARPVRAVGRLGGCLSGAPLRPSVPVRGKARAFVPPDPRQTHVVPAAPRHARFRSFQGHSEEMRARGPAGLCPRDAYGADAGPMRRGSGCGRHPRALLGTRLQKCWPDRRAIVRECRHPRTAAVGR